MARTAKAAATHGQQPFTRDGYRVIARKDGERVRLWVRQAGRAALGEAAIRKTKAVRDGIQLSQVITGDGAAISRHACGLGFEGIVSSACL